MHDNYVYFIVPMADLIQAMLDVAQERSAATLRHNVAGVDRVILKCSGYIPDCLLSYEPLTLAEATAAMATSDWQAEGP